VRRLTGIRGTVYSELRPLRPMTQSPMKGPPTFSKSVKRWKKSAPLVAERCRRQKLKRSISFVRIKANMRHPFSSVRKKRPRDARMKKGVVHQQIDRLRQPSPASVQSRPRTEALEPRPDQRNGNIVNAKRLRGRALPVAQTCIRCKLQSLNCAFFTW